MHRYRAFVEAAADNMLEEGNADRVPSDSLARAAAQGFSTDTFELDVLAEVEARTAPADPRQLTITF